MTYKNILEQTKYSNRDSAILLFPASHDTTNILLESDKMLILCAKQDRSKW